MMQGVFSVAASWWAQRWAQGWARGRRRLLVPSRQGWLTSLPASAEFVHSLRQPMMATADRRQQRFSQRRSAQHPWSRCAMQPSSIDESCFRPSIEPAKPATPCSTPLEPEMSWPRANFLKQALTFRLRAIPGPISIFAKATAQRHSATNRLASLPPFAAARRSSDLSIRSSQSPCQPTPRGQARIS